MQDYTIQLHEVEELQMIKDVDELNRIFARAKSTIVQGEKVIILRTDAGGNSNQVDELTTESELQLYKASVLKYL
jgi:hypothetical protein